MKKAYDLKTEILNDQNITPRVFFQRPEYWFLQSWEKTSRDQRGNRYSFPETELMVSLVSLYLVNVNIFFPIVHAPTFKRFIAEGLHLRDEDFGATVLLVCAIGSRYSADPRVLCVSGSELSSGYQWFAQVQMLRQSLFEVPSLYELQYYCLAILYLIGTPDPSPSWVLVAIGIRFSCELGLHRRKPDGHKWTAEEEQKMRAFWRVVTLDKLTASFLGRSCAIHDEDVDADLPVQCDDEYWENENETLAFKQPAGKPAVIAAFVSYLRLCDILDFALRTLYSTRKSQLLFGLVGQDWREKIVSDLDSSLNEWVNSLPAHLRSESGRKGEGVFAMQSAFLYTAYYHLQIYIHRPFLSKPSPRALPSLSICTTAARSCAHVLDCQQNGSVASLPHTQYAAFVAGVVLLFNLWESKRTGMKTDQHREIQHVEKILKALEAQEVKSASAGRFRDLLMELKRGYDHPTVDVQTASNPNTPPDDTYSKWQGPTSWEETSRASITKLTGNNQMAVEPVENRTHIPSADARGQTDIWSVAPLGFNHNEWVGYIENISVRGTY
ncbi:fungal-specific transcription factor domain-containing protein [Lentinula aciculospora]|uniref:Fungal-specific transcription factor domain-containing protein n=1 Tax=Lentinula aciculospora TaxID=153920 RepID=A0A9W9DSB7_9AGAR|nr:fungal-specific transcription factor domain-containing protein [Lentinula aciculospora]